MVSNTKGCQTCAEKTYAKLAVKRLAPSNGKQTDLGPRSLSIRLIAVGTLLVRYGYHHVEVAAAAAAAAALASANWTPVTPMPIDKIIDAAAATCSKFDF